MSKQTAFLQTPAPPSLPVATTEYTQRYQDQYSNVLRLYFNQLSGVLSSLTGQDGGQYVDCPNGLFFNTQDQTFGATGTAYPVVFDNTYLHNAVALKTGSTSQIQVTVPGIYNFQYTGQVLSTNSSAKTIYLWIKRNNVTIGYSTRATTININNGYVPITWNFDIDLDEIGRAHV